MYSQNSGNRSAAEDGAASGGSSGDSVFTPGTEGRLERLPAMLGAPVHDVYLGGAFPVSDVIKYKRLPLIVMLLNMFQLKWAELVLLVQIP